MTLGIESGSASTRDFIRKQKPLSQAKNVIGYANRLGIWTNSTNIIGFPNETKGDIRQTYDFARASGVDFASFYILSPVPGSDVAKFFPESNYFGMSEEGVNTVYFSAQELKKIQKKLYQGFILHKVFRPWFIFGKIRNWEDFRYVMKLVGVGIRIFWGSFFMKNTLNLLYKHKKWTS